MRLARLTVSNFQGIAQAEVQPGTLTMIYGPNGAGKSSLADALLYVLTGEQARGRTLGRMIRTGAKGLDVAAVLEGEERIEARRKRTASAGQSYVDGGKVKDGSIETHIERAFGVEARAISAALRSGQILEMGPAALQDLLADLSDADLDAEAIREALGEAVLKAAARSNLDLPVDLGGFPDAMRKAEAARQAAKRALDRLEGDLSRLPEAPRLAVVPNLADLRARRDAAVRANARRDAAIASATKVLSLREVELAAAPDVEEPEGVAPDLAPIRARREAALAAHARRAGADEAKAAALRKRIAELQEIPAFTEDDAAAYQAAVDANYEAYQEHKRIEEALAQTEKEIEWLRPKTGEDAIPASRLPELDAELAAASAAGLEAAKKAASLTTEGKEKARLIERIPSCGSIGACPVLEIECPVKAGELVQIGATLGKAKAKLEAEQKKALAAEEAARLEIARLTTLRSAARLSALVQERTALAAQLEEAEATWHRHLLEKERLGTLRTRAETRRHLPELEADLAEVEAAAAAPEGEDLAALDAELRAAEEAAEAHVAFGRRIAAEEAVEVAREEMDAARALPAGEDVAAIDEQIAAAEAVRDSRAAAARRADLEREIAEARQEIEDADLVAKACGPKGAPAALLSRVAGSFLHVANNALVAIFPNARVDLETEGGLSLVAEIGPEGAVRLAPDQLSDGERTRFLFALQYAVSRLAGVGILVLDRSELIDADAKKAVMRWVSQVTKAGTQVLMVTSTPAPSAAPAGLVAYAMAGGTSTPIPQAEAA